MALESSGTRLWFFKAGFWAALDTRQYATGMCGIEAASRRCTVRLQTSFAIPAL
jgi:hypothetical protein